MFELVAVIPRLIKWAADLITRYQVGPDGPTAVQRIRGAKSARAIAQFGEKVMYQPAQSGAGRLGKPDERYFGGIVLGMRLRSDEVIIGTEQRVIKGRSVCRFPEGQQWD